MQRIIKNEITKQQPLALVVRYGAYGDAIMVEPVFRKLKEDGYYTIFNCTERGYEVHKHNPNVDCFLKYATDEIPNEDLSKHWDGLKKRVDRFINLSGSIEENLLKTPAQPEYNWPHEERHKLLNRNYQDETMAIAGYPDLKGQVPRLWFKEKENIWGKAFREKHKGFLVVCCLSGSSHHKVYPYMDSVVQAIVEGIPEAKVVLVGEGAAKGIIDPHERVLDLCGSLGIRKSMVLTKYADLVISPETAIANAASCFDTPKVVLLSHSSEENLTKYWRNCFSVFQPVSCYPCHKLHYERKSCPLEPETEMPVCVALLHPSRILEKVELIYNKWKETNVDSHTANPDHDSDRGISVIRET